MAFGDIYHTLDDKFAGLTGFSIKDTPAVAKALGSDVLFSLREGAVIVPSDAQGLGSIVKGFLEFEQAAFSWACGILGEEYTPGVQPSYAAGSLATERIFIRYSGIMGQICQDPERFGDNAGSLSPETQKGLVVMAVAYSMHNPSD